MTTPTVANTMPMPIALRINRLPNVLTSERADLNRLFGEIRAGSIELFADQGVVAGRHEKRELVVRISAGDLNGAGTGAGLRQQQAIRQSRHP